MGTKNNPGEFDCYAKAHPDEPLFILRGKDPVAPYLVSMWVYSRQGDWASMHRLIGEMSADDNVLFRVSDDTYEKLGEAKSLVGAMEEWFRSRVDKGPDHVLDAVTQLARQLNSRAPGARKLLEDMLDREGIV